MYTTVSIKCIMQVVSTARDAVFQPYFHPKRSWMQEKNEHYIKGLQSGDKQVFGELFGAYYEPLCRFCMQRGCSRDTAEEIVQEIFVKLWVKRKSIKVSTSINAYLYRMALNTIINQKKHLEVKALHRARVMDFQVTDTNYFQGMEEKEISRLASEAVASMPEKRRMVYELSRGEGLKYSEIAQAMGISVKTVEVHLSAALKHMRKQLKDYLPICFLLYLPMI